MAAMASMTMKSSTLLNCGASQKSFMSHANRAPLRSLRVKCNAEADSESKKASSINDIPSATTSTQSAQIPTRSPVPPVPTKKVSTKFSDVFAFSGPAPETINGRLAMVGFVSAVAVELASGQDLVSQLNSGGLPWFVYSVVMLSAASLVPMFSGISAESKSQPIFSSSAEMLNGRLAMIGLAALAVTEFVKGGPLV
ncbi:early light-induced protein 1, chloroplastic isoform X2 [Cryptomeria japonica]|uniref:early light-induced protein 1, chloroplastic isoform X2 n=1 Tax=Cryptomeria japonica TaxID=3369 RepID=UPI0027DA4DEC|nr:early light-induced protein 1, chloroplastic isoform X2 [Cryptomeria japonica]